MSSNNEEQQKLRAALRSMKTGTANEGQQIAALNFIINDLCLTFSSAYVSEKPHDTAFNEGKRKVGLEILQILNSTE